MCFWTTRVAPPLKDMKTAENRTRGKCFVCQVRHGLRLSSMLLLLVCVFIVIISASGSTVGGQFNMPERLAEAIGIYVWLAVPACILANMALWLWCRHAHQERAGWKSALLIVAWLAIGYVAGATARVIQ